MSNFLQGTSRKENTSSFVDKTKEEVAFIPGVENNEIKIILPIYAGVFIAQLVEHCRAKEEAMESNPVEVPKYSSD